VAHNPGLANPEISKIIGMQWRVLTEGEKNKWRALAEVCRNISLFSGYFYSHLTRKRKLAMLNNIQLTAISRRELAVMETLVFQDRASVIIHPEAQHVTIAAEEL